ncbi:LON peptidase substrate-binding domain-containing protein [Photobacterium kagoshimensis]|uniref:LON peptidase substrate-binding domain-containing protein n=1 Tax=Photobacterium kagoshimensis TaxID=2910242 RepID=UPI003D1042A4
MMQLPLFPLKLYLLPGGISTLRIFEPKYVRLIKMAMASNEGFGLCMQTDDHLCHFGSRVVITDFDQMPDGLLGITVRAIDKFVIDQHWTEDDGLIMATTSIIPNWTPTEIKFIDRDLSSGLQMLFEEYPEHAAHYPQPDFEDMAWVCQRWLEILPLGTEQKQWFMSRSDHKAALSFLHSVIDEELKK